MRAVLAVVFCLSFAAVATADTEKPWERGVSKATRSSATTKFQAGNAHFEEHRYREALVEYRAALAIWDHPAIRFNMAVCLINIEQPLEAHEHLQSAMRYGESALGSALFTQGRTYQKLLDGSLATVTVRSEQSGVTVSLDGDDLFVGPGEKTMLLLPGVRFRRSVRRALHHGRP